MSIFGSIMGKIFHHDRAKAATTSEPPRPAPTASSVRDAPAAAVQTPSSAPAASPAQPLVDVGAVLEAMATMKPDHGGNYRSSIVDLLKLLDLDSSLSARKELAVELGVQAGADGSAEQNTALHKAVMDKLAQNGGVVPDSLRQ